jgi:hypothetical protein
MKKVIGLSGVAQSGKDTFASILESRLQKAGRRVKKIALADPLKSDCNDFITKNFGFSAFTQVPEEKTLIRPMFVWYGDAQRKRTGGRYWINKAQEVINHTDFDFYIITDVRYAHYTQDEIYWLQEELNGVVCHISKWTPMPISSLRGEYACPQAFKEYVQPANDHEALNDPKIKALADYKVDWKHVDGVSPSELVHVDSLNKHVDSFITFTGLI